MIDELSQAVAPFIHSSGGMPGGASSGPPGPFGENLFPSIHEETREGPPAPAPTPVEDKEIFLKAELADDSFDPEFKWARVQQEQIALLLDQIFLADGFQIPFTEVRKEVDVSLTEVMAMYPDYSRIQKLEQIYIDLGRLRHQTPIYKEIIKKFL